MMKQPRFPRSEQSKAHDRLYHRQHREAGRAAVRRYRQTDKGKMAMKTVMPRKRRSRVATNREYIESLKQGSCEDCGQTFMTCAMDFDHVRGEKRYNIGYLVGAGASMKILDVEIMKCDLVCACCHRIRTWKRRRGLL